MNFLPHVFSVVEDVIKSVLPRTKMDEEAQYRLEKDLKLGLLKADWKRFEKEVEDRVSARSLAKEELDKGNVFTNVLAATHRPLWSFCTLFIYIWSLISPQFGLMPIVLGEVHENIMMSVIIFYFGGRSVEKVFKTLAKKG